MRADRLQPGAHWKFSCLYLRRFASTTSRTARLQSASRDEHHRRRRQNDPGAREANIPLSEFTAPFKQAFFEDCETLRIKRADEFPAATDQRYIDRMVEMIGELISRGLAYQADDKSVYFRINKFPDYGKLAHFDLTQLQSTGRVKHDEYDKEHIGDFALWKAWDEEDGDVAWESPWGRGRPGWHIECSAMSTALLGDQIDIHCGGVDNIFPHHEAEIAQSEGVTGKKFVRYWLHCAHLLVDGQKMSKSLGNFYTLPNLLEKGYTGREIRYALMRVHYRAPLNFTWEGMEESRQALARVDEWLARLRETANGKTKKGGNTTAPGQQFEESLDDDLNISAALGFLFESIRETNRAMDQNEMDAATANAWLDWWKRINSVLDLEKETEVAVPLEVARLAKERESARNEKNWKGSDELRDRISALGWEVRDTKDGQNSRRVAVAHASRVLVSTSRRNNLLMCVHGKIRDRDSARRETVRPIAHGNQIHVCTCRLS